MSEPQIYVVDDDAAVGDSMRLLLRPLETPITIFNSAEAFLEQVTATARGCLVVDLRMPGLSGIELLQRLRALGYELHIVMLTGHADVATVTRAMKLGALDFLEKPCPPAQIIEAVKNGLQRTHEGAARTLQLAEFQKQVELLTADERAVLTGLVLGRTNPEIAEVLDVSLRTVQGRRASIFEKFNVTSRAELVERALSAGWNPKQA